VTLRNLDKAPFPWFGGKSRAIGALLGTLTIEEADRVAAIAQTCTLTLSDDGSPLVAVAS
jgi:hypothetical protein